MRTTMNRILNKYQIEEKCCHFHGQYWRKPSRGNGSWSWKWSWSQSCFCRQPAIMLLQSIANVIACLLLMVLIRDDAVTVSEANSITLGRQHTHIINNNGTATLKQQHQQQQHQQLHNRGARIVATVVSEKRKSRTSLKTLLSIDELTQRTKNTLATLAIPTTEETIKGATSSKRIIIIIKQSRKAMENNDLERKYRLSATLDEKEQWQPLQQQQQHLQLSKCCLLWLRLLLLPISNSLYETELYWKCNNLPTLNGWQRWIYLLLLIFIVNTFHILLFLIDSYHFRWFKSIFTTITIDERRNQLLLQLLQTISCVGEQGFFIITTTTSSQENAFQSNLCHSKLIANKDGDIYNVAEKRNSNRFRNVAQNDLGDFLLLMIFIKFAYCQQHRCEKLLASQQYSWNRTNRHIAQVNSHNNISLTTIAKIFNNKQEFYFNTSNIFNIYSTTTATVTSIVIVEQQQYKLYQYYECRPLILMNVEELFSNRSDCIVCFNNLMDNNFNRKVSTTQDKMTMTILTIVSLSTTMTYTLASTTLRQSPQLRRKMSLAKSILNLYPYKAIRWRTQRMQHKVLLVDKTKYVHYKYNCCKWNCKRNCICKCSCNCRPTLSIRPKKLTDKRRLRCQSLSIIKCNKNKTNNDRSVSITSLGEASLLSSSSSSSSAAVSTSSLILTSTTAATATSTTISNRTTTTKTTAPSPTSSSSTSSSPSLTRTSPRSRLTNSPRLIDACSGSAYTNVAEERPAMRSYRASKTNLIWLLIGLVWLEDLRLINCHVLFNYQYQNQTYSSSANSASNASNNEALVTRDPATIIITTDNSINAVTPTSITATISIETATRATILLDESIENVQNDSKEHSANDMQRGQSLQQKHHIDDSSPLVTPAQGQYSMCARAKSADGRQRVERSLNNIALSNMHHKLEDQQLFNDGTVSGSSFRQTPNWQPSTTQGHADPNHNDRIRLESIKQQILTKLGLSHKPNISQTLPKQFIWDTLYRADGLVGLTDYTDNRQRSLTERRMQHLVHLFAVSDILDDLDAEHHNHNHQIMARNPWSWHPQLWSAANLEQVAGTATATAIATATTSASTNTATSTLQNSFIRSSRDSNPFPEILENPLKYSPNIPDEQESLLPQYKENGGFVPTIYRNLSQINYGYKRSLRSTNNDHNTPINGHKTNDEVWTLTADTNSNNFNNNYNYNYNYNNNNNNNNNNDMDKNHQTATKSLKGHRLPSPSHSSSTSFSSVGISNNKNNNINNNNRQKRNENYNRNNNNNNRNNRMYYYNKNNYNMDNYERRPVQSKTFTYRTDISSSENSYNTYDHNQYVVNGFRGESRKINVDDDDQNNDDDNYYHSDNNYKRVNNYNANDKRNNAKSNRFDDNNNNNNNNNDNDNNSHNYNLNNNKYDHNDDNDNDDNVDVVDDNDERQQQQQQQRQQLHVTHPWREDAILSSGTFDSDRQEKRRVPTSNAAWEKTATDPDHLWQSEADDEEDFFGNTQEIITFAEKGSMYKQQSLVEFTRQISSNSYLDEDQQQLFVQRAEIHIRIERRRRPSVGGVSRTSGKANKRLTIWIFQLLETDTRSHNRSNLQQTHRDRVADADSLDTRFCASWEVNRNHLGWQKIDLTSTVREWYSSKQSSRLRLLIDCTGCGQMYHLQLFETIDEKAINENYGPKPHNNDKSVNNIVKLRQNMKLSLRASSKRLNLQPQSQQQTETLWGEGGQTKRSQKQFEERSQRDFQRTREIRDLKKAKASRLQQGETWPSMANEQDEIEERREESNASQALNPSRPFLVLRTETRRKRRVRRRAINCNGASHGQCCKESFYVSFKALGWDDWIIAPRGYFANYCRGDCTGTYRTPDTFQTIHAHFIDEYRKMGLLNGMQPCCAPIKFSSMSLIYYGDEGIIKRDLPKMVVDECGCP